MMKWRGETKILRESGGRPRGFGESRAVSALGGSVVDIELVMGSELATMAEFPASLGTEEWETLFQGLA